LVEHLLNLKHEITVIDLMIYGNNLPKHENLITIKGDIRNIQLLENSIKDFDVVIHLACISNDPSFDLDPKLGKSINLDCFEPLVKICKKNGVKRFIYASSSSVYGIKEEKDVNENSLLEPLTDYSKFKVECEKILLNFASKNFNCIVVRPATVCGYSVRQRLDVVVNILTNLAYHKKEITVLGGSQLRPNIHIKDMVRVYEYLINTDINKHNGEIFNAGYENLSVMKIANTVKEVIGNDIKIKIEKSNDNRSYHISSEKIKKTLNYENNFTIKDAIYDLKNAFDKGLLKNTLTNEMYFNIKRMNNIELN
jgi:nucleoside-diphosphate-sugar epimerase